MIHRLAKGQTAAWRRLAAPLRYLSIRHDIKYRFDWGWPITLTVLTMALFWVLPVKPEILGDNGVLKAVRDFIALLAAFFVVALAAIATFALETLDQPMEGTTPTLGGRDLTRRQFVCYLFGYLCVLSFGLFLACVLTQMVAPSLYLKLSPDLFWWVKAAFGMVFAFGFWNMIVTTLLGIYFLVERVHISAPAGDVSRAGNDRRAATRHDHAA
jgi:hypothetical protein